MDEMTEYIRKLIAERDEALAELAEWHQMFGCFGDTPAEAIETIISAMMASHLREREAFKRSA